MAYTLQVCPIVEIVWILYPKVWEIGLYTLKFGSVDKTPPSISLGL